MYPKPIPFVLIFFAFLQICFVQAHGDLTNRINRKSAEIKLSPNNDNLYFERGFLYHQHDEFDKAISDLLKAQSLGNTSETTNYYLALSYKKIDKTELGLKSIELYLKSNPNDVKGIKLKGLLLAQNNEFDKAKSCFDIILERMVDIRPEDYIFYSDFVISETQNYNSAINIIEEGLTQLGNNSFSLQIKKLDYLKLSNNPEKILDQYDFFINSVNRKEFWYYKKAKYLAEINDNKNALHNLELSKQSINKLKPRFQNLKAIKDLQHNITQLKTNLKNEK